ncbi:MAG: C39 family peptidase [Candidatus Thorarchaeota archaeon]|nr:C39 family peptidase [Candidatus Thorarchaeota archaeon]
MKRKIVSSIMIIVFLCSLMPVSNFLAAEQPIDSEGLQALFSKFTEVFSESADDEQVEYLPLVISDLPPVIPDTTEVLTDSTTFTPDVWADYVVFASIAGEDNQHTNPTDALGPPDYSSSSENGYVSLGGGFIVVDMGSGEEITNGFGNDLRIYNPGSGLYEEFDVYVSNISTDDWYHLGAASGNGESDFDLDLVGLSQARFVRITDTSTSLSGSSPGTDIDYIAALHSNNDPFADKVLNSLTFGLNNTHTDPTESLGFPDYSSSSESGYISLGEGGELIIDMGEGEEVLNGPDDDLRIYNPGTDGGEKAEISVSANPDGPWSPVGIAYGSPQTNDFDINPTGFSTIRYVKIKDVSTGDLVDSNPATDIDYLEALHMVTECSPEKWNAEYFSNQYLQGSPALLRCDQNLDFYWGTTSPDDSIPKDNFSVRWERTVDFSESGWYRFRTFTDDGLRLYIDGELIIDDWSARSFEERSVLREISEGSHLIIMEYVEWSNEAMAHLDWYLCPDGASDCDLNITPQYQTSYLDQPMPADCTSDVNQTLARWGCLITSLSMNMQAFAINTDPAELNQWFTDNDYYLDPDNDGCNGGINQYTMVGILQYAEENGVQLDWNNPVTTTAAVSAIRDNYPVIMQVSSEEDKHWTLGVDVLSNNGVLSLGLNDPHHSYKCEAVAADPPLPPTSVLTCTTGTLKHATTVEDENIYRGITVPFGYLKPLESDQARTPSLALSVSGAEILLTDDQGNQVGYDQANNSYILDIPNSFYFNPEIVPFGDELSGLLQRIIYIARDAVESYRLRVINPTNQTNILSSTSQDYTIEISGFDEAFNRTETTITGTIGDSEEYLIEYSPGKPIDVIPISVDHRIYLPMTIR